MTAATSGTVVEGFEPVAEAFAARCADRGRASFAVYHRERLVVDLWSDDDGGESEWSGAPLQPLFSGTKALVTACILMLAERDLLDLDAPVKRYWPEFGRSSPAPVRLRDVLCHTSGLPGIRRAAVGRDDLLDSELMARLLADEQAVWAPGTVLCYHPLTFGWILGELVRRVDGRSVGRFFREEIARPHDLELWIGLPAELLAGVPSLVVDPTWAHAATAMMSAADPELFAAVYLNPDVWSERGIRWWGEPATRCAEIPGANGIGTARAMARFFALLLAGGDSAGGGVLRQDTLMRAMRPRAAGRSHLSREWHDYGCGFTVQGRESVFGPVDAAFGHGGAGGSLHGAWPRQRIAFSFAMSHMRDDTGDDRASALLDALARCVPAADWQLPRRVGLT